MYIIAYHHIYGKNEIEYLDTQSSSKSLASFQIAPMAEIRVSAISVLGARLVVNVNEASFHFLRIGRITGPEAVHLENQSSYTWYLANNPNHSSYLW